MGSSSTCVVAGYWYSAGMHLVFCTGVDELLSIVADEKTAWEAGATDHIYAWRNFPYCYNPYVGGSTRLPLSGVSGEPDACPDGYREIANWERVREEVIQPYVTLDTGNDRIYISKKTLFGGEDREGGIDGYVDIEFGSTDQPVNDYLTAKQGADIPAYRGVFGMVLRDVTLSCNTPQIKPWSIRARRTVTGWEPTYDRIADDMNPVHIICDCLFDADWGGIGLPESKRGDSFATVAAVLHTEGLGLSFVWARNESIEDFVSTVLRHIDATIYQDYETGKLEIKLVRDDYGSPLALDKFDTSNIINVEDYDTKSTAELINTVTIKYTDPTNGKDQSVTLTDISAVDRANGEVSTMEKEYFGVSNSEIATKIATRELRAALLPLSTVTFMANRDAFGKKPGDVINFTWEPYGFADVAMRITAVDIGSLDSSAIRIDAVADVFAFGDAMLTTPPDSSNWEDPLNDPTNVVNYTARELNYWQLTRNTTLLAQADTTDGTYLQVTAESPTPDSVDFELHDRLPDTLDYRVRGKGTFSEFFTVTNALDLEVESTLVLSTSISFFMISSGSIGVGSMAYIDDEIVGIIGINETMDELLVSRGLIDTVPVEHAAEATLQFISTAKCATDTQEFTETETVNYKMLPSTSNGRLDLNDATEYLYTFLGRLGRPYPPGNVTLCYERYPSLTVRKLTAAVYPQTFGTATCKATSKAGTTYYAYYAVNPGYTLIGQPSKTSWIASSNSNQKFSIDLGEPALLGSCLMHNVHNSGTWLDMGVKNFQVFGTNSNAAFLNVSDYADETDLTLLGTFVAAMHVAANVPDPQIFDFDTVSSFRYVVLKIANNHGHSINVGMRHFEVLGLGDYPLMFSHRDRLTQVASIPESQLVGDVGPEEGTTYNIEVIDEDSSATVMTLNTSDTLLQLTGIDSASVINVNLGSERDSQESHTAHSFTTRLIGYGKSYGLNYGGIEE